MQGATANYQNIRQYETWILWQLILQEPAKHEYYDYNLYIYK